MEVVQQPLNIWNFAYAVKASKAGLEQCEIGRKDSRLGHGSGIHCVALPMVPK